MINILIPLQKGSTGIQPMKQLAHQEAERNISMKE